MDLVYRAHGDHDQRGRRAGMRSPAICARVPCLRARIACACILCSRCVRPPCSGCFDLREFVVQDIDPLLETDGGLLGHGAENVIGATHAARCVRFHACARCLDGGVAWWLAGGVPGLCLFLNLKSLLRILVSFLSSDPFHSIYHTTRIPLSLPSLSPFFLACGPSLYPLSGV